MNMPLINAKRENKFFEIYTCLEKLPLTCRSLFENECEFGLKMEWFHNVITNGMPPRSKACFGVLFDGQSAIAMLPMQRAENGVLSSLSNCYTCMYHPIIVADAGYYANAQLLGRALEQLRVSSPLIWIDCLPSDWPALDAFATGAREAGLQVRKFDQFGNWHEPVRGRSWERYLAARPGNLRELLRRRSKELLRRDISFEIISGGDRLSFGIAAYEAIYKRSWKPGEPFPRFNASLMRVAADLGMLRLGICWQHEQPIAAQLWIIAYGTATVMKLAHDEAKRAISPGTLLMATMIERLLDEGIVEIDFGRGDDPYKRLWAEHRRQRIGLFLANPRRLRGLATILKHDFGGVTRQWRHPNRHPESR